MEKKFYDDGLQFECTRCSYCCRHEPGFVFLSEIDLKAMVDELCISEEEFINTYCTKVDIGFFNRLSLAEKKNHDCIFWSEEGCRVYKARPLQCRSYPFWTQVVEDKDSWDEEAISCPGISQGTKHSKEEIEEWLKKRKNDPLISS
jgi:Fe-S-cluster containining protein